MSFFKLYFKRIFYYFKLRELNKKAIISEKLVFGLQSILNSESRNDIFIDTNVMMYGCLSSSNGGKIKIGKHTSIRPGCKVFCSESVDISNNVIMADNVIISDTNHHPIMPQDRLKMIRSGWGSKYWSWKHAQSAPVKIGSNVWLGQYSRVLKGVTIGEGSIVASNAVVTKNVPVNTIVAGNPAVIVKSNIHQGSCVFDD